MSAGGTVVVVGIGNELRGDDAAGLEAARLVAEEAPQARVLVLSGEPSRLLDGWEGAGHAIVIDACRGHGAAGEVHRFEAGSAPLPAEFGRGSTHALGLADAIELARALGRLPERVSVFAIEGEGFEAGTEMTPAVRAAAERVARLVARASG